MRQLFLLLPLDILKHLLIAKKLFLINGTGGRGWR